MDLPLRPSVIADRVNADILEQGAFRQPLWADDHYVTYPMSVEIVKERGTALVT
jgi:hypothetical protein